MNNGRHYWQPPVQLLNPTSDLTGMVVWYVGQALKEHLTLSVCWSPGLAIETWEAAKSHVLQA
jgi:hypothetical protein